MEHHPYSEIWPLMDGKDFEKLKSDIAANGLRMNLIVYEGKLLDGRNRERACEAVGVAPRYAEAGVETDDAALKLLVSLNHHRRHLSLAQRALAADKLANIINGHNRYETKVGVPDGPPTSDKALSRQTAADMIGVSVGALKRMRTIRTKGTEADVEDVVSGKVTLNAKEEDVRKNPRKPSMPRPRHTAPPKRQQPTLHVVGSKLPFINSKTFTGTNEEWQRLVDPEFTGTPMDFTDKYGHVQTMTAEGYATIRFNNLMQTVRAVAKTWRTSPVEDRKLDLNWLRNPDPVDVNRLAEALEYLRPRIAEAEQALAVAQDALAAKKGARREVGDRYPN